MQLTKPCEKHRYWRDRRGSATNLCSSRGFPVRSSSPTIVTIDAADQVYVHVENGNGGWPRDVQAPTRYNENAWTIHEGRPDDEKVFERIPRHLDVHSVRREFAQALYQYYANGRDLPPASGRLRPKGYDRAAAERVTWAMGHNRIDVVLRHIIR